MTRHRPSLRRRARPGLPSGLLALAWLVACAPPPAARGRLQVAVSVPPQAYVVRRVGGGRVDVEVMVPPGQSHVDHALSPRQMVALARADLYVEVGHPAFLFERRYIVPFLAAHPRIRTVDMAQGMALLESADAEEGVDEHGDAPGGDPHVWVAPESVAVAAGNIESALAAADPAHAGEYRRNRLDFLGEVTRLDHEIHARLDGAGSRAFMVYHPSWGYFARQYGLTQIAIESGGKEPSAARLIALIEEARRAGVKVIFIQGGFPRKSAQVIADAVGGRVVVADPQEYDWLGNLRRVARAFGEALAHERQG